MLAVLLVLLAFYLGLLFYNGRKAREKEKEEEVSVIHVTDTDAGTICSLTLNVGSGELIFEKQNDQWVYTPDPEFPLDQSYPQMLAEIAGNITAERELTDPDDMGDYGLDEPVYTIRYTQENGAETVLFLGNMSGDCYYAAIDEKATVYTVESSVIDSLNYTLDDVALLDTYPGIGSGNLLKVTVLQSGQTIIYDSENEEQTEDIAAIAGGFGAVSLSEVADYSAENDSLGNFGLDEDTRITVQAVYEGEDSSEETLTLYIGGSDGAEGRYVMINDSRIIYVVSDEICKNILNEQEE